MCTTDVTETRASYAVSVGVAWKVQTMGGAAATVAECVHALSFNNPDPGVRRKGEGSVTVVKVTVPEPPRAQLL